MRNTLRRTVQYFSRSKALSISTVVVMASTFLVSSLFVVAAYGSHMLLNFYESRAQISAFFKDVATEPEILSIKTSLEATGKVSEVRYISKEEALKIYIDRYNEDPSLLESIASNILPASLDIKAKDISDLPDLAEMLNQEPLVEDVIFYKDIVKQLRDITHGTRLLQIALVALQMVSSTFIVLITIALIIYSRSEEIEIMQLVGATRWQIRWPFVLQGVLFGAVASLISSVVLVASLPQMIPYFEGLFVGGFYSPVSSEVVSPQFLSALTFGQMAFGILLGALGSFWATWKYLK